MRSSTLITTLLISSSLFGETVISHPVEQGLQQVTPPERCLHSPRPIRVSARYYQGNGVGFRRSYSTLEAFASPLGLWHTPWMPFVDLRGHVFNDGRYAGNGGVGVRYLSSTVYGGNLYYDFRKTRHKFYNQVGAGLEVLGRWWGVHLNSYIPVGSRKSHFYGRTTSLSGTTGSSIGSGLFFSGHTLFLGSGTLISTKKVEFDLYGADAHAEIWLGRNLDVDFVTGFGPYFFWGKYNKKAIGGRASIATYWRNYVQLGLAGTYDNLYHARGQVQVALNLPLGPKERTRHGASDHLCGYPEYLSRNLTYGADRFEIIVTKQKKFSATSVGVLDPVIDPLTGQPYVFWFVNNTSHSDGTFESPFNTLVAAQNASAPNDIIYVYPGDGTSTGMDAGITLQNNQRLWGTGIAQTLPTTTGTLTIPALSSGSPSLTTLSGNQVVLCANNNEIAGTTITNNSSSFGILMTSITTAAIHNNTFIDNNNVSVEAVFCSGNISVTSNLFQLVASGTSAIDILDSHGGTTVTLSNNSLSSQPTGQHGIILSTADTSSSTYSVNNNQFNGDFSGKPFTMLAGGTLSMNGNTFANAASQSLIQQSLVGGSALKATVNNNSWIPATTTSLQVINDATSTLCINLTNNTSNFGGTAYNYTNNNVAPSSFSEFHSNNTGALATDGATSLGSTPCP